MITLNTSSPAQPAQLSGQPVSSGATKAVADTPAPGSTVEQPQAAAKQPTTEQLKGAVDSINQAMRQSNRGLEFSVDSATKRPIVKMVDMETGEVIRQIPSDETLAISRSIDHFQQGLLLKQEA
ncbi:MAG: flagellar protein FlaG [Sulfuricella denitrificans]|nr:flagellar protein FlaG [Sulfuricella denitrificans]